MSQIGPTPNCKCKHATDRTQQLLRRFDLGDGTINRESLEKLQAEIHREPTLEKYHAMAELAYIAAKQVESDGDKGLALDMFAASVAHSYWYLFDGR